MVISASSELTAVPVCVAEAGSGIWISIQPDEGYCCQLLVEICCVSMVVFAVISMSCLVRYAIFCFN